MHLLRRDPSFSSCFAFDEMLCAPLLMSALPAALRWLRRVQ